MLALAMKFSKNGFDPHQRLHGHTADHNSRQPTARFAAVRVRTHRR
jgi:hypothetical protein